MALHAVLYTPLNLGLQSTAVPIWHSCQLTSIASRLCRRCLFPSPRRSHAADTVHNLYYRHRCPVHGTAYASLFLHPSASVITQLGQSCSAATHLSLHTLLVGHKVHPRNTLSDHYIAELLMFVGRPLRAEARQSCYESQSRTIH